MFYIFASIGFVFTFSIIAIYAYESFCYINDKMCFMIEFLGFGFIIARDEMLKQNLNKIRKTKDKRFFIKLPMVNF